MTDWAGYVAGFHEERPGITEDLLALAEAEGRTPYAWAGQAVPAGGRVLDLCCGSAPLREHLTPTWYVGMDLAAAELARAAARGVPVVQADATRLPLPDACVDAVVVSMALMLVPLRETLEEIARVLRPGGVVVATLPAQGPLPLGDLLRYGRLSLALRVRGISYPNDAELADFPSVAGLRVVEDSARAFLLDVDSVARADLLLDALYLPEVAPDRLPVARRVVAKWVGHRVAIPIRRIVLSR